MMQSIHDTSVPDEAEFEDLHLSPTDSSEASISLIPMDTVTANKIYGNVKKHIPSLSVPLWNKDTRFLGLYAIQTLITLIAAVTIEHRAKARVAAVLADQTSTGIEDDDAADRGVPYVGIMVIVGTIYSLGWLYIFFHLPKDTYIRYSTLSSFAGLAPLTLVLLFSGSWGGFFLGVGVGLIAFSDWIWARKNKLGFDFVASVFDLVSTVLLALPSVVAAALALVVGGSLWAYWAGQLLADVREDEGWSVNLLWLFFHFYWTSHLFHTLISILVSGTVMYWYHHWGDQDSDSPKQLPTAMNHSSSLGAMESPTTTTSSPSSSSPSKKVASSSEQVVVAHYVRMAISHALGSACFAALVCPIAHVLWTTLRMAKRDDSFRWLRALVRPAAPSIDAFIQLHHKYALVFVAGFGNSFAVSAADAWALMHERGVEAIVDDDLTSRLLLFVANGCAGCMGTLCNLMLTGSHLRVYGTIVSFLVGYFVCQAATTMLNMTVKTLFICFAVNPARLAKLNPIIYHRFMRLSELKTFGERR
ncbi:Aste57867_20432 [Aphanomyces stellatus]|uniref:Choline transporter-like protein n=1 Tax=Aphanomyces stellatus TaxID=120398 RepID=A0A485LJP9_9STRA|nr:hypothetical protein As57867_020366 [Aphanomyces stellatus]VFT97118.1 Aste57867_20432 [Aphanomyces stellatus]